MITPRGRIPQLHNISTDNIAVRENGDCLIDISSGNPRIIIEPAYYNRKIPGATEKCYMRESVYHRLLDALEYLPDGYGLKIFDAWRPYEVQRFLYDEQVNKLLKEEALNPTEAMEKAKQFVSYPEKDPLKPFVHATGGAVDLTVIDENNAELDMGTCFDDFSALAATDSFENSADDKVKNNRRLLYSAMISAGFTNYPYEWWHYDYGDLFWAAEKNSEETLFGGKYSEL